MSEIVDLGAKRFDAASDADKVATLHKKLVEQNVRLIQQLELLGRHPNQVLFIQCAVEALLDVIFGGDKEALATFHLASDTLINEKLLLILKELTGETLHP